MEQKEEVKEIVDNCLLWPEKRVCVKKYEFVRDRDNN